MTDDDLPLAIPFLLFLTAFVLIGIYPTWQRTEWRIRNYLHPRDDSAADTTPPAPLKEIEFLLMQRLALTRGNMFSAKRLAGELHLQEKAVEAALATLNREKLVRFSRPFLIGKHYALSARGHRFAIGMGFIPDMGNSNLKPRSGHRSVNFMHRTR